MPTENSYEKYVYDYCKHEKIICWKLRFIGRRGFPDRFLAKDGVIVFLELKTPRKTGVTSKIQHRVHKALRAAGCNVYITSTIGEFLNVIEQHYGRTDV